MLVTILTVLGTLIPSILMSRGVIGASTDNLITGLLTPVEQLFADLKAGNTKTSAALAVLAAASGVIAVLKSTTNLPADTLTQINGADKDVQAALSGYVIAGKGLDLSIYKPIAEV